MSIDISLETIQPFAEFLGEFFNRFHALPSQFETILQENLLILLKEWARDGVRTASGEKAVLRLFMALRETRHKNLWAHVATLLQSDPDFRKSGSPMQSLVLDILVG
ncbi:MAG: hypothetical protein GY859_26145 [Desulfobacterales bacterium]|nr:hypothetical protein [Desulfobacterales bacterium]